MLSGEQDLRCMEADGLVMDLLTTTHRADSMALAAGSEGIDAAAVADRLRLRTAEQP